MKLRLLGLFLLLIVALPLVAQEEETETVIRYFHSTRLFNVPILNGWENLSEGDTALFKRDDLNAQILVTAIDSADSAAAIRQALAKVWADVPTEPRYTESISLADGLWLQAIYQTGSTTASAMAQTRSGVTYVVTLVEQLPDADMLLLVERPTGEVDQNAIPMAGVQQALTDVFGGTWQAAPEFEPVQKSSGMWTQQAYTSEAGETWTTFGFVFANATYTALTNAEPAVGIALSDAFNTIFLGFFTSPDNDAYLWLGVAVMFVILGALVLSLWLRYRNATQDERMLAQLHSDEG